MERKKSDNDLHLPGKSVHDFSQDEIDAGIEWMSALLIPDGKKRGQPFNLEHWQREWINSAMQPGIQVAGLSIARKNAKTMLNVLIQACFLAGPWNYVNFQALVCADVGENARKMVEYLMQLNEINYLDITFKRSPPPGRAEGKHGSAVSFRAADSATGHAGNVDMAWIDEAGALGENLRPLWNAMYSAISSRNGKFVVIGNQREGEMFREMALRAEIDKTVHFKRYMTPLDVDPLDPAVWHLGNPGLGTIKSIEYMHGKAMDAKVSPANMTYFQSFDLNQDVDPEKETIVSVVQWKEVISDDVDLRGERVVLGIDLGGSISMSAAVAIGLESGMLQTYACFSSKPDILARGRADGVDRTYIQMRDKGELWLHPGEDVNAVTFINQVMNDLNDRGCQVILLAADRYRKSELQKALYQAGVLCEVDFRGVGAGQDGLFDITSFQRLVVEKKVSISPNLGMANAILNSHIEYDTNKNPRLMKNKSRGRIDLLSAALLASGLYQRMDEGGHTKEPVLFRM